MNIALLHLSDIHISNASDPILRRTGKIRSALHEAVPEAAACVIVVSGDVAFSGKQSQYEAANIFFQQLKTELLELPLLKSVHIVCVPGNHDCDFDGESDVREFLLTDIQALYKSGIELDGEKAKTLLAVQNNFFHFEADAGGYKELPIQSRIAWGRVIDIGNLRLKFQCFNTAWLSRIKEQQSKLFMPSQALEPYPGDSSFSISVFHHPYNWLDSNNYRQLKQLIEQSSDFVFTGHEHEGGASSIERFSGEHLQYIEGAALKGDSGPFDSGFNVIALDVATGEQRFELFRWNGELYSSKEKRDWKPLIVNPARQRHLLSVNQTFARALNDTGTAYTHKRARTGLTLDQIFVYPRMRCWSSESLLDPKRRPIPVSSKGALAHFHNTPRVLLSGPDDSGKTSLLKKLFLDLSNDFVPLFIDATKLRGRVGEQRFVGLVRGAVSEQYDSSIVERYLQLEPSRRLLIVDNFHRSNLSPQNEERFLRSAEAMFEHVIVAVSDLYRVREMLRLGTHEDPFRSYDRCDLLEFGHALRAVLIEKWLAIGRVTAEDLEDLERDVSSTEKIVTSLLGKNVVPSFPFNILTILQMMESSQSHSTVGTSFGHLHETLIKASLSFDDQGGGYGAEIKFNYSSLIAFHMFEQERDSLTELELREIADEYRERFQLALDFHQSLIALVKARVLDQTDGNYRFRYKHFYYYFVAKYLDRAIRRNDSRSMALREQLKYLSNRLHSEEFANIVLFYVHLSQDWSLVSHILDNANSIYSERLLCDFEKDVQFVNALYKETPKQLLIDTSSVDQHREAYRDSIDKSEEEGTTPISLDAKIAYREDLEDVHKVNISLKTLQVLGQVLRSATASLEGDQKIQIISACYRLGLRTLNAILQISNTNIEELRYYLASLITERAALQDFSITDEQLLRRTDEAVIGLTLRVAYGILKKISFAVGSQQLQETYAQILQQYRGNMAVEIIDVLLKLDHFRIVPEYEMAKIRDQIGKNPFAYTIVRQMVTDFLYLYKIDIRTAQKLGALFSIKATVPELLLPDFKKD